MILVTGATGRLGGHVVRALRRMGYPVRALVRRGSAYFWLNDTGCSYFFADLRDESSLRRACAGVRHVVSCAGVERETRANNHQTATDEGHARLWRAARDRGVERAVLISALLTEGEERVPAFRARRAAERSLQASGLSYSILRSAPWTRIYAEYGWEASRGAPVWLPGSGAGRIAPISPADAALYAIAALDLPFARDRIVEIGGTEARTSRAWAQRAADLAGGGEVRAIPSRIVRAGALLLRPAGRRWENRLRLLDRWFSADAIADCGPMIAATGIHPRDPDAALREDLDTIASLRDPKARDERVVALRTEPATYRPRTIPLDRLPTGPLRYDE